MNLRILAQHFLHSIPNGLTKFGIIYMYIQYCPRKKIVETGEQQHIHKYSCTFIGNVSTARALTRTKMFHWNGHPYAARPSRCYSMNSFAWKTFSHYLRVECPRFLCACLCVIQTLSTALSKCWRQHISYTRISRSNSPKIHQMLVRTYVQTHKNVVHMCLQHFHNVYLHIYIYMYICVCMFVCAYIPISMHARRVKRSNLSGLRARTQHTA